MSDMDNKTKTFDKSAATWDTAERVARSEKFAEKLKDSLKRDLYDSAMEFGCGTGLLSSLMQERFNHIALVDSSKGMIDAVNEKIQDSVFINAKAYQKDITEAPLEDMGKFDAIYSSMALHHIQNTDKALKSLYNLLADNGEIYIIDLNEDDGSFHGNFPDLQGHHGFNQSELLAKAQKAGYKNVKIETFYHGTKEAAGKTVPFSLFMLTAEK